MTIYKRASVSKWFTCQCAYVLVQFTCQRVNFSKACQLLIFTCQPAKKLANVLRANLSKAYQLLIFTCQLANKPANVPYGVPMFQLGVQTCQNACQFFKHSFYKMLLEISILFYYKKFYIILDIIIMHMIYRT